MENWGEFRDQKAGETSVGGGERCKHSEERLPTTTLALR